MNYKKILKHTLIGILSLLVIAVAGLFLWSATSTYPAREVALASLETTEKVTVSQDKWIVFTPDQEADIGLIFYPGGLVDPAAYAPVLHQIAEKASWWSSPPCPSTWRYLTPGLRTQ